ncbi:MAG: hypothetical protein HY774_18785 [Acidobacteria bacterium]|nr:hypothetical protein [Acidobacteriota bacterium]
MEFFFYLISAVVCCYVMARRKRKYIFGWLVVCLGLGFAAYNGLKTPTVTDFVTYEIQYAYCFYDRANGDVVFGSENETYLINQPIYQNQYTGLTVADRLAVRSQATIWVMPNSKLIEGIKTDNLYLPPENGLRWKLELNKHRSWLGLCVAIAGLVIVGFMKLGQLFFTASFSFTGWACSFF